MVIYNKGERIIIFPNGVLRPSCRVKVDDAIGAKLMSMYTGELECLAEIVKPEPKVIEEEVEKVEEPVVVEKPKKKTSRRKK